MGWEIRQNIKHYAPSNSIAELRAIQIALQKWNTRNQNEQYQKVIIYSDSKFLVDQIHKQNFGSKEPQLRESWEKIQKLWVSNRNNENNIEIKWVPAHCGIKGNE